MAALYCHNRSRRRRDLTHNYTLYWLAILSSPRPPRFPQLTYEICHWCQRIYLCLVLHTFCMTCMLNRKSKDVDRQVRTPYRTYTCYTIKSQIHYSLEIFYIPKLVSPSRVSTMSNDNYMEHQWQKYTTDSYFTLGIYRHFYRTVIAYF